MADKARNKAQDKAGDDLERRDATKLRRVADRILHKNLRLNEVLLDSLPHPAMLIRKDRTILAVNSVARQLGAKVGGLCWQDFGQSEFIPDKDKQYINDHKQIPPGGTFCVFCMADEALDKQFRTGNAEIRAWDKIWDMNWIPLDEETFLHYAIDVTYITKEDEKLRMSELKYRTLAENIPGLVYRMLVRQNGTMLFFNNMLKPMTGFEQSELATGKVCSIAPHIVPEDRDEVASIVKYACNEKEPFEVEYRFEHKDKSIKWFKEIGRPVFGPNDELLFIDGIITDITERKETEKVLQDRREKWRSLAETAPVTIMNVSRDGTIKFINRVLEQHTLEQVIGSRVYDYIPQDQHDRVRKFLERAFETGKPDSLEILAVGPEGPETAWYENHIGPILDQNGKVANVTMIAIDITERKRAEKELREKSAFRKAVIERAAEGICVCHDIEEYPHVAFTVWNERMEDITGYTMDEINRLGWYQTVYPDSQLQQKAIERMERMHKAMTLSQRSGRLPERTGLKGCWLSPPRSSLPKAIRAMSWR